MEEEMSDNTNIYKQSIDSNLKKRVHLFATKMQNTKKNVEVNTKSTEQNETAVDEIIELMESDTQSIKQDEIVVNEIPVNEILVNEIARTNNVVEYDNYILRLCKFIASSILCRTIINFISIFFVIMAIVDYNYKIGYVDTCTLSILYLGCKSYNTKTLNISTHQIETINNLIMTTNYQIVSNQTEYKLYYTYSDSDISCTFFANDFNNMSKLIDTYNNIKNTTLTLYYKNIRNNICSQTQKITDLFPLQIIILFIVQIIFTFTIIKIYKYSNRNTNTCSRHIERYDKFTIIMYQLAMIYGFLLTLAPIIEWSQ